jgi:hypothetical protein
LHEEPEFEEEDHEVMAINRTTRMNADLALDA